MALRLILTLCAALMLALTAPAGAQDSDGGRDREIAETASALSSVQDAIAEDVVEDPEETEERLRELRDASHQRLEPITREIARLENDLNALGAAPGENDPPESASLAERRESLNDSLSRLRGHEVQITANIAQATDLLAELSARRIGALYERVLERGQPLFAPSLWAAGLASAGEVNGKIAAFFADWGAGKNESGGLIVPVLLILAALAVAVLIFGPVNRWISQSFSSRIERLEPTPSRRVVVAGLKMIARAGPGIVGGLIVFLTLRAQGIIIDEGAEVARAAWFALVAVLLVNGFASGLLNAANPAWRIAPGMEERGRHAARYLTAIVVIFGVRTVLAEIADVAGAAEELERIASGVSAVAIGVLIYLLSRGALWRPTPQEKAESGEAPAAASAAAPAAPAQTGESDDGEGAGPWRPVRRISRFVCLLTIAAPFVGYVALADFVTARFYYLALILAVAWFARALLREAVMLTAGRMKATRGRNAEESKDTFDTFWVKGAIDVLLLLALAPMMLILVGFEWTFVRDFVWQAFFGFQIGGVRIPSVAKILAALLLFIVFLGLTRFTQRSLARGPFKHSRMDVGVQNSLTTLVGYAGFIVALLVGIMALGFELGNLAIIAGALSVGIGFGLQSIVNNFVSGLILLFERPIKVGDWIITTSGEGTVKKISVRSTEIETFDRSSIIIPNSELIAQSVTNWTHKNKFGRITVPVGVAYGSDPEKVKEILLQVAKDHRLVLGYPEPFVVWQSFGEFDLQFELRAYLRDILDGLGVRTELRFAIFKAFNEAGIEIPFPQRDVHIKSMPAAQKPDEDERAGAAPETPEPDPASGDETDAPSGDTDNPIPKELDTSEDD